MKIARIFLVFLVPILVSVSFVAQAGEKGKFGPEGEKRIIELTKWLEENPLETKTEAVRAEILEWWVEAPHVTLNWCSNFLIEGKNKKVNGMVLTQGLFGAGAFILENPKQSEDGAAYSLAGVESALVAYRNAISKNKKMKDKFFESLVNQQMTGNLNEYIMKILKVCEEAENE